MRDNTHAAMCVYCGETIIYDTRKVTDMAAAHAQIVEHDQQCPKNPLVARIAELERYNLGLANESCELQERVARLNKALTRQANAATLGMDAAKKVAGSNLEQAKRLHAESSPQALESEREANALLTERVSELEAYLERLTDRVIAVSATNNMSNVDGFYGLMQVVNEKPAASLARHDAQIKANELKRFIGIYLTPGLAHNRATGELQSLQKQAEGHQ